MQKIEIQLTSNHSARPFMADATFLADGIAKQRPPQRHTPFIPQIERPRGINSNQVAVNGIGGRIAANRDPIDPIAADDVAFGGCVSANRVAVRVEYVDTAAAVSNCRSSRSIHTNQVAGDRNVRNPIPDFDSIVHVSGDHIAVNGVAAGVLNAEANAVRNL